MLKKMMCVGLGLFLFCLPTQGQAELVSEWKFDGNAEDSVGNNHGTLKGNPTWAANRFGDSGKALSFDGVNDYVDCGNDASLSFGNGTEDSPFSIEWQQKSNIRPLIKKGGKGVGILTKQGEYSFKFNNSNRMHLIDSSNSSSRIGRAGYIGVDQNNWTHIVVTYDGSGTSDGIKFYQAGVLLEGPIHENKGSYMAMGNKGFPLIIGKVKLGEKDCYFNGSLDYVRIYNHVLSLEEINENYDVVQRMPLKKIKELENSIVVLEKRVDDLSVTDPVKKKWKQKINTELSPLVKKIQSIKSRKFMIPSSEIAEIEGDLTVKRLNVILAAFEKIKREDGYLSYVVPPISGVMILPNSVPGKIFDEVRIIASPGEYEPGSFVIVPFSDISSLNIESTDLKGKEGNISSANIDIKSVKCWYQTGTAWDGSGIRGRYKKLLVPELLLNDDSLVKVDYQKKDNYLKVVHLRGTPSEKEEYILISDIPKQKVSWYRSIEQISVKDSSTFLPVDIPAMANKQFWITVKVPEDAMPGRYTGKINLSTHDKLLGAITLKLRVLPFKLASPKVYYDLNHDFICSLYYRGYLHPDYLHGTISSHFKNEEQMRAELKNMFAHGINNPVPYYDVIDKKPQKWEEKVWGPGTNMTLFARDLAIRKEVGMTASILLSGVRTSNPQDEASLNALKKKVRKVIKIARSYGFTDIYFYGIDEALGKELKSQRLAWKAVHEAGGKVWVSGTHRNNFDMMKDLQDLLNSNGDGYGSLSQAAADKWHSVGGKITSYSSPQVGAESPEIFRRNYGLYLWKQHYDGMVNYGYQTSFGSVWNDFDHYYRDHNFTYPTINGVIDTIAFEGNREAIDDIKYGTTLKLLIEKGRESKDKKIRDLSLMANNYLEQLDTGRDLDAIRLEIIGYILKLQEVQ